MDIRNYGEIILCRNITFEDNKYDMEQGHPGVVILPTTERDEQAICLYMTSDKRKAREDKFTKYEGGSIKDSYVNLQQLIKVPNNREEEIDVLDNKKFLELLRKFYNFQINLEEPREEFLNIKEKVEILLELLEFNIQSEIEEPISMDIIEELMKNDSKKRKALYETKKNIGNKKSIEIKLSKSERERVYYEKVVALYNRLNSINFDKIDLNNLNNEIRNIYMDFRSKNYLVNVDIIFNDVIFLFDNIEVKSKLQMFMQLERERAELKKKSEEEKREAKVEKAAAKKERAARYYEKTKYRRSIAKYGNSEFFK